MPAPLDDELKKRAHLRTLALELMDSLNLPPKDREHVLLSRLFLGSPDQKAAHLAKGSSAKPALIPLGLRIDAAHRLGVRLDQLHRDDHIQVKVGTRMGSSARKRTGSFFTPPELARRLIENSRRALEQLPKGPFLLNVLDPAVGGGAFLLEAGRLLSSLGSPPPGWLTRFAGVDRSELSLAVADAALRMAFGPEAFAPELLHHDTLKDELSLREPVDWIVSNPPWVAYQGRAAVPLPKDERAFFRKRYRAFHGYPTLQGMFVERSAELAPRGVITLLLPSSLADLDGYSEARRSLARSHTPAEPLEEFGQDAFEGVVQPSFGLIASPRPGAVRPPEEATLGRPFRLTERKRQGEAAEEVEAPLCLRSLLERQKLPAETFGECGFQSNRVVTEQLFSRSAPLEADWVPLLEGKNVQEFSVGSPRLWLDARPDELRRAGVRLRPRSTYERVDFVVRQTASYPIAAVHTGLPFRNSLLAGFASEHLSKELLVGLLNSTLYRALFVSMTRDARQAVFPQIKIGMLRKLPAPPEARELRHEVARLAERLASGSHESRDALDAAVYSLFELDDNERASISQFFKGRIKKSSSHLASSDK